MSDKANDNTSEDIVLAAYYELCDLGGDLTAPDEGCKVRRAYRAMIEASNG